ncbi:DUF3108 domain-containing protein [Elioraea sp.]|jgi:hypothetical protein|uniref:DUF3108 domain-containing protein n=1 Tax=Elioraea sp. TaxID=2185103 RepID=UPI0021DC1F37|nr:DUF3108 domain-containing protein [Elioraea sp.]GIX09320.1 MAG: hypothetical protein KatS3mg116_1030 [Elioraea sp.]
MRTLIAAAAATAAAVLAPAARAGEPVLASYTAYFSGFSVAALDAAFALDDRHYRMVARMRTIGILAAFVTGEQTTEVEGTIRSGDALGLAPARYAMDGRWRDRPRRIAMAWPDGRPEVLALVPANTEERDPVPPELQHGTVDTLTAIAALLRRLAATGRCEGEAALFDGRRRTDVVARTEGEDRLEPHRWGVFAGPALRCSVEGRQVAGFRTDQDRAEAGRPRSATAWFARPAPDLPPIPVRIEAETGWGPVYVHLTRIGRGDLPVPTRQTRN